MKQHLLYIIRSLARQKIPFFINLMGIIIGMTAVILATAIVVDEIKFDKFHNDHSQIFRVNKWNTEPSGIKSQMAETPGLMAPTMEADFHEVAYATRMAPWFDEVLLTHEHTNISTSKWLFTDPNFFEVFDFKIITPGSPKELIDGPGQILITPDLAIKLFGKKEPVGKLVQGVGDRIYQVTGLVENPPRRSHIQYEIIASWASTESESGFLDFSFMNNWLGQTVYTYLKLGAVEDALKLEAKLAGFTAKYMPNRTDMYDFYLQSLADIYLQSDQLRYLRGGRYGSINFLKSFSWIALLILIIACFNYINITTARSLQRSKEVGVKKVLGASKTQLVFQFILETFLLVLVASLISLTLSTILLPEINLWFDKSTPLTMLWNPIVLAILSSMIIITSIFAGAFPGLLLSRFRPIEVLKSARMKSPGGKFPREVLTTLQLSAGIGLIAAAFVFQKQFKYLLQKDLGFNKEQVLSMSTPPGIDSNYIAFQNELNQMPGVLSASMCQAVIQQGTFGTTVIPEGSNGKEVPVISFRVDSNYLNTFGMTMVSGRFFNRASDLNSGGIVVNETMVNQMGWVDPLNRKVKWPGNENSYPIIGVIKDFHYNSLHEAISPIIMYLDSRKSNISIRFNPDMIETVLEQLSSLWKKFEARYPLEYQFLDESFAQAYTSENRMVQIITAFALIAILIGCMGIYGVVSISLTQRRKEIGIRKVLGSSNLQIIQLIIYTFLIPLGIAFIIAVPIVNIILQNWLQNYAFHLPIQISNYLFSGLIMSTIVILTIASQSIYAARTNPVKSLRNE